MYTTIINSTNPPIDDKTINPTFDLLSGVGEGGISGLFRMSTIYCVLMAIPKLISENTLSQTV
jgi:hypothetical protein